MTVNGPWTFSKDDPAGPELENRLQDMFDFLLSLMTPLQGLPVFQGTGNPNGAVTASPPAIYLNRAGGAGTTLYVKEAGVNTNLNWVGK
jgi:hypothetical protein